MTLVSSHRHAAVVKNGKKLGQGKSREGVGGYYELLMLLLSIKSESWRVMRCRVSIGDFPLILQAFLHVFSVGDMVLSICQTIESPESDLAVVQPPVDAAEGLSRPSCGVKADPWNPAS